MPTLEIVYSSSWWIEMLKKAVRTGQEGALRHVYNSQIGSAPDTPACSRLIPDENLIPPVTQTQVHSPQIIFDQT